MPYGAEAAEFEKIYNDVLMPFVCSLNKFPEIQALIHYSGVLLNWVERSHPELFMLIEDMVSRKQIEMLSGGFYEPILPIIPLQDKIGQIELLTTYLRKQFGKKPHGCWIPAFAWEQNLVSPLVSCDMGYTFLHESQFSYADNIDSPCICEDQGKIIIVFPIWDSLSNTLAKKSIKTVLQECSGKYPEGKEIIISIFPCSKAVGKGWNQFFEELSKCGNFAETITPGKLYKNLKGLKKIFIPDSASIQDVPPRSFIAKNHESSRIYSKMIFTNVIINQFKGDKSRKKTAREEIWKAQNCALYSNCGCQAENNALLRNASYSALLSAERLTRERGKFAPSLVPYDINTDNIDDWLFHDTKINCYVQSLGGGIFELDYLPKTWNYLNTINNRLGFADRLLPFGTSGVDLENEKITGTRFCQNEYYELLDLDKSRRRIKLMLRPRDNIPFGKISIKKSYSQKKDSICVSYSLINSSEKPEKFQFSPMIDLSFHSTDSVRFFSCKSGMEETLITDFAVKETDGIKIHDLENETQILFTANRVSEGRISPVYLIDNSKKNKFFQAYCIMPVYRLSLAPQESYSIEFILKFTH